MYNGIINVYKERGFTSHDVVAKLRGILKQKKIGHTGTLDPEAEGVLPVCLGKGTKLCDLLTDKDKTYKAVLLLGISTDTQDTTGTVIEKSDTEEWLKEHKVEELKDIIMSFVGEYNQIPPMYSALKVNGRKLYELAREGIEVERKARKIVIYDIVIESIQYPRVTMTIKCSKGTYIRTLCHDIGEKALLHGCMEKLVRTKVSTFTIENSLKLAEIEQLVQSDKIENYIMSIDKTFESYKKCVVSEEFSRLLYNGNVLIPDNMSTDENTNQLFVDDEQIRVYDYNDKFVGLYRYIKEDNIFKNVKMFYEG